MTLVITLEQSGFIGKSVWTYGSRSHLLILLLGRRLCRALFIGFLHRFPWSSLRLLLCYVFTSDRIAISRWHISTLDSMSPPRRPFEASLQAYAHKVPGGVLVTKLFRNRCLRCAGSAVFVQGCVGWGYIMNKITADSTEGHARKIFCVADDVGTEEALTNATEILSSALQTAYQCAEDPDSTQSPVIMTLSQLIENAQALVDAVLERDFPTAK